MATQKSVTVGVKYYTSQYAGCVNGGRGQSSNLPYGLPHETDKNNFVEQGYIIFDNTAFSGLSTACEMVSSKFSASHSNNGSYTLDTVIAAFFSRFTKTSVSGTRADGSAEAWGYASGTDTHEVLTGARITDEVAAGTTHSISGTTTATSSYPNSKKFFGDSAIHIAYRLYARYINRTTAASTRYDYLSGVSVTVTYNARCYVTFQGDGITAKKSVYDYGATPSFGSTPTRTGYTFKGWKSGSTTYTGALPTAGEVDVTYIAVWEKLKHTVSLSAGQGGSVTGGGTYDYGSSVTIEAIPHTGYHFVRWSDGNTNAERTLTVTANVSLTAYFEADKINKIYLGSTNANVYIGSTEAGSVNVGNTKIYG